MNGSKYISSGILVSISEQPNNPPDWIVIPSLFCNEKVYGPTPPNTELLITPLLAPLQLISYPL